MQSFNKADLVLQIDLCKLFLGEKSGLIISKNKTPFILSLNTWNKTFNNEIVVQAIGLVDSSINLPTIRAIN